MALPSDEAGHLRLDATSDEDRSRVRAPKAMTVPGMFHRLAIRFACARLDGPLHRQRKPGTRDFLNHLNAMPTMPGGPSP